MSEPEFVYVIYIQTTPDKVWQALLDPEMTKEFWGRHRNRSDWTTGASWQHESYDDASEVAVTGTVIEATAPHRLVLSWSRPAEPDKVSQVTFAIDDMFGAVRLTVTHRDLDAESAKGVRAGWPAILSSLKTLLETGASMPMTRRRWAGKANA